MARSGFTSSIWLSRVINSDYFFPSGSPFTLSVWAKPTADTVGYVFKMASFSGGYSNSIYYWTTDTAILEISDGSAASTQLTNFTVGKWHHLAAVVRDNANRSLFVDGVEATLTSNKSIPTQDWLYIGGNGGIYPFVGTMGPTAIWNSALTTAEIAALRFGASPLSVRRGSLFAYWRMDKPYDEPNLAGPARFNLKKTATSPSLIYDTNPYLVSKNILPPFSFAPYSQQQQQIYDQPIPLFYGASF